MNTRPILSIILPVYNPHSGWEECLIHSLNELKAFFSHLTYTVVLVNDGSTENVDPFYKEHIISAHSNIHYLSYPTNLGKGHAIRYALQRCESEYYVYTDFDFPFGYRAVADTLTKLVDGRFNLVISTREKSYFSALPFKRRIISKLLMLINSFVTGFRVKDTQAGLKGLDNKAKNVFLSTRTNSFIFELEFILNCLRDNLQYTFINVKPNENIIFSNFNFKTIKRELKSFICIILKIWPAKRF